jgi:hypothetical protein
MRILRMLSLVAVLVMLCVCPAAGQAPDDVSAGGTQIGPLSNPPAGQIDRYIGTYMKSRKKELLDIFGRNSATVVTVINNQSSVPCSLAVQWFQASEYAPACTTIIENVEPGRAVDFCSREIPDGITTCNSVCKPALNHIEGKVRISSTNSTQCAKIAVEARVLYFDEKDSELVAISNSNIVKKNAGNSGN